MPSKPAGARSPAPASPATLAFGDVVLVPIPFTSQAASKQRPAAGLLKPSAVKPVFATLELGLVIRRLGALTAEDQDALRLAIGQILG